jgi:serine/threonine protein kinase
MRGFACLLWALSCPFVHAQKKNLAALCGSEINANSKLLASQRQQIEQLGYHASNLPFTAGGQAWITRVKNPEDRWEALKTYRDGILTSENEVAVLREIYERAGNDEDLPFLRISQVLRDPQERVTSLTMPLFAANDREKIAALNLLEHQKKRFRRLARVDRVSLLLHTLRAVTLAHRYGYIHRDLTPANLPIDDAGRVRLLDWAYACARGRHPKGLGRGSFSGNFKYCSQNQLKRGPANPRDDLEALRPLLAWDILAFGHPDVPKYRIERLFQLNEGSGETFLRPDYRVAPELSGISRALATALWSRLPDNIGHLNYLVDAALTGDEDLFLRKYGALMRRYFDSGGFKLKQDNLSLTAEERTAVSDYLAYDLLGSRLVTEGFLERLHLPNYMMAPIRESGLRIMESVSGMNPRYAPEVGPHPGLHFSSFLRALNGTSEVPQESRWHRVLRGFSFWKNSLIRVAGPAGY